jgi:hypothetical protein
VQKGYHFSDPIEPEGDYQTDYFQQAPQGALQE